MVTHNFLLSSWYFELKWISWYIINSAIDLNGFNEYMSRNTEHSCWISVNRRSRLQSKTFQWIHTCKQEIMWNHKVSKSHTKSSFSLHALLLLTNLGLTQTSISILWFYWVLVASNFHSKVDHLLNLKC